MFCHTRALVAALLLVVTSTALAGPIALPDVPIEICISRRIESGCALRPAAVRFPRRRGTVCRC